MCLRWIAHQASSNPAWPRVLDYGCGFGILAIGAALHGAQHVDAVDIDMAAVESTRANAHANHVRVHAGLPDAVRGEYALCSRTSWPRRSSCWRRCSAANLQSGGDLVLPASRTPGR